MGVYKRARVNSDGKKTYFWYIRYTVNGKLRRESVGKVGEITKDVAHRRLNKKKSLVQQDRLGEVNTEIPTLKEITPEYLKYQKEVKQKRSWKEDERHLRGLNRLFGDKKLSQITSKDIDDYKYSRSQEVAAATVNRELSTLRTLYNLAKRWKKFFGDNPVSESGLFGEENTKERILSYEEEQLLLDSSADHLKPIIITALNTGMRKGELISLKWKNIDFDNGLITVRKEVSKSNKPRKIPLNSKLRQVLLEQKLKTGFNEYVFLNPSGDPYTRHDSLKRSFEGACSRANINGLRFHDLRHTAATRMVEAGVNIVAVSRILGHASITTTMRYAHPDDSLKGAVESLSAKPENKGKIDAN